MNHQYTIIVFIMLSLTLSSSIIGTSSCQQLNVPSWLQKGTYAEYSFNATGIRFYNATFLELDKNTTTVLRWDCIDLNSTTAKLAVTIKGVYPNGASYLLSGDVFVNISSRDIYLQNGTLIGTTTLWQTANPSSDQPLVLWNVPPDRVEMSIDVSKNHRVDTPQGIQKSFVIQGRVTGLKSIGYGGNLSYIMMYDYDTGVLVDSINVGGAAGEGILKALGIFEIDVDGRFIFNSTNIDLGPGVASSGNLPIEGMALLIVPFPVLFIVSFVVINRKRKRAKRASNLR